MRNTELPHLRSQPKSQALLPFLAPNEMSFLLEISLESTFFFLEAVIFVYKQKSFLLFSNNIFMTDLMPRIIFDFFTITLHEQDQKRFAFLVRINYKLLTIFKN